MTIYVPGRTCLLLAAAIALMVGQPLALAQGGYPTRVVRIIVPTVAGGGGDTIARMLAQGFSERWGRQVLVDNRTGASSIIGTDAVAKAPPDGHTLLQALSTLTINPSAHKKLPYDTVRDFAPITQAVSVPNLLIVHPSLPAKSVKEMIALAKARPGQVFFASSGYGTSNHLALELFASMAQVRLVHVPYKSAGPALIDLMAGQIAIMATNMIAVIPQVRAGKLRALGVTSLTRAPSAPDIPTVAESGLPGYEFVQWYGLLAPAGTPREIIDKIHRDAAAILHTPEAKDRFAADGGASVASSPDEFAAFIKTEIEKWAKVFKAAGLKPE
jgi:tripartite-type tricarboxylate transporter receptor subunit TctC